jgi:hypothetical protein
VTPRARRRIVGLGTALAVVVLTVIGLTATCRSPESVAFDRRLVKQLSDLRAHVACAGGTTWRGDPYFWDRMRGVDCYTSSGAPVFIRVYAHTASVPQVLQDWAGTFSGDRALVHGERWFVIGPRNAISPVAERRDAVGPSTSLPSASGPSPAHEEQTTCVRFLSAAVQDAAINPEQFAEELPAMDRLYPGAERTVRNITSHETIEQLRAVPQVEMAARLGDHADVLNKICARAAAESSSQASER